MYVLRNLSRLNDLPDALRSSVFKKLFEQAKIANMTKEELDEYQESLKDYRDMYLIEDPYKRTIAERDKALSVLRKNLIAEQKARVEKDRILVVKDKALTAEQKAHQKALAELAELKRRFGIH